MIQRGFQHILDEFTYIKNTITVSQCRNLSMLNLQLMVVFCSSTDDLQCRIFKKLVSRQSLISAQSLYPFGLAGNRFHYYCGRHFNFWLTVITLGNISCDRPSFDYAYLSLLQFYSAMSLSCTSPFLLHSSCHAFARSIKSREARGVCEGG